MSLGKQYKLAEKAAGFVSRVSVGAAPARKSEIPRISPATAKTPESGTSGVTEADPRGAATLARAA
jgi:hypothetical protein